MNQPIEILRAQIRECFGRVVYTHKTHEKAADIALARLERIKNWQIALSALTTGTLVSALADAFQQEAVATVLAGIFSSALLLLNTYTKRFDLGKDAQAHRGVAASLWDIRESYLSLLTDLESGALTADEARLRRDELQEELGSIYASAPSTNGRAYKKAQEALKYNEDYTFSDDELDAFLPKELHKTS